MRKVIITEEQEKYILGKLREEQVVQMPVPRKVNKPYCINPEKVQIVKKYLDNQFTTHDYEKIGDDGYPTIIKVVAMNAGNGEPLKYMYPEQLTDLLIDRYQKMFSDENELELFMKQVVKDWCDNRIDSLGTLSVNRLVSENMTKEEITDNANMANTNPTQAQKEAGNYRMGHIRVCGMPISIENPKGSKRYYKNEDGSTGYSVMKHHYGYFKLTDGKGKDGDAIDVFVGPHTDKIENVYVVDQNTADGDFDEVKVMLGFRNEKEAKNAYMSNYSKDWKGFRDITTVPIDTFKKWLYRGSKQIKPFSEYAIAQTKKKDNTYKEITFLEESQLERLISESITSAIRKRFMLNESQESKSISEAVRLYMERTGKSREEAEEFIRITLRSSVPTLRDKQTAKFILGVTRMALDGQLRDATSISNINSTLKYVGDPTHINEYDRNLNGLSAEELIGRFAKVRTQDMEKDKADIGKSQFQEKKEYKVIRIDSFEQIRQYGKYNDWCLAQDNGENMYDTYTSDGVNQLYLILRDGFENEPREAGSNAPYDAYGLSMMTVIVDPDGQMTQSTTRWNHENGSSDSAFTPKQISEIIGRNFYDVFKPNTKFKDAVEDALKRMRNGEDPRTIFDYINKQPNGMMVVELMGKNNLLTPNKTLLFQEWLDVIGDFHDGFARISLEGKGSNFINTNGEILSDIWFDSVGSFNEGLARIYVRKKGSNYINTNGEIISKVWFSNAGYFINGFARVYIKEKGCNFINSNGEFISKVWFDEVYNFQEGFAVVKIDGKGWNFINTNGEIISNVWFDSAGEFRNGVATVIMKGEHYNLEKNGKLYRQ